MRDANVLVVEDDETIRQLLIESLRHHYLSVDGARDGVEALHRIITNHYAVMVLDLMMPKMSGVDLLDSLDALTSDPSVKAIENPPAVLVITGMDCSALPDDVIARRCPRIVHGVFRKPLDIDYLAACVEKCLPQA
ncbi:MAG: two-component system, NtrC family, nitrogen regulation response regulator GlnG [Thermoanaerobaculia bacterium]|jgi:DNA-binding response OmpR family regulator|nr:two-component system, NtrC family, nitrogen regulation response regulator GlnG [Thermoanaerobaculia bacterium]